MVNAALGPRNSYTAEQINITARMTEEFRSLGFATHMVGEFLVASKGSQQCYVNAAETSFTSLLAMKALRNKDYAKTIFRSRGLSVAEGQSFRFSQKDQALRKLGELLPAVVKPLDGRQGKGVSVCITADTFSSAWEHAKVHARSKVLIERLFPDAQEARYLVVAGKCIAVSMRLPPMLLGDGRRSVRDLVEEKNRLRLQHPDQADTLIDIQQVAAFISASGHTVETVLEEGEELRFDWRSSYYTGDSLNVTTDVHESMKRIAERATAAVPGADVIGIDILARDHSSAARPDNYIILEANTQPGLRAHLCPVFGEPINVCRAIAEHCVKQMAIAAAAAAPAVADEPQPSVNATASDAKRGKTHSDGELVVVLCGDTSLGDAYAARKGAPDDLRRLENNPLSFFEALTPLTSDSSLVVANLETVLTGASDGSPEKMHFGSGGSDRTISTLLSVGINVVSLANNHTMTLGARQLLVSVASLEKAGISVIGAGANAREAAQPLKFPLGDTHLYILAGYEYRKKFDTEFAAYATDEAAGLQAFHLQAKNELSRTISRIRASDPDSLIIAYPHWAGARNYQWATPRMVVANDGLQASGADLVLGHGSHMMQQCMSTRLGTTVFSLGNFVFNSPGYYRQRSAPPYSFIARLTLSRTTELWSGQLRLYPTVTDNRVTGYRSRPVSEAEATDVYALLDKHGDGAFRNAFAMSRDERGWYITPTKPLSPRFTAARSSIDGARRAQLDRELLAEVRI